MNLARFFVGLVLEGEPPPLTLQESIRREMERDLPRRSAARRLVEIFAGMTGELQHATWFTNDWVEKTLNQTLWHFDQACERWRSLYRSALHQRDTQHAIITDASRSKADKDQATRLRQEAENQISLLTDSQNIVQSDFYSYRYFASEGFLQIYDEMAVAMRTGQAYQTRLDPPPADPAVAHPWDEQYLGPVQEPATWWREVAVSAPLGAEDVPYATNTQAPGQQISESRASHTVSSPAPPPTIPAAMQLGFGFSPNVWPAPRGDDQTRRARLLALTTPGKGVTTEDDLCAVTAFLADPQPELQVLASQFLRQQGSPLLVAILADFLNEAEAARLALARPAINRLLHSIVETAKEENVRRSAQALLVRTAG